ncbi:peptidoglycan-binding domain-containing protein [Lacrimispora algidixylanolytica]|uniref:Peptidoglycan-binding protein n=1 Tax=Lacrimispora algidixylanolytica TaxID=94868 RepID=A0A419T0N9_9FIRM|nr:peptidoglycan-binding domain-containing protein [Lacrimispora algidixylanolytica]RKD31013.1 peptidoglycan-binding protein [Lacrimispora algidixylanolytica]
MIPYQTYSTQENNSTGLLQINVVSAETNFPIPDAEISISYTGDPESSLEQVVTDSSGQTEEVSLAAPPVELSRSPSLIQPYSEYTLLIRAPGFEPVAISGTQILADTIALQPVRMTPIEDEVSPDVPIVIPDHTLYGSYPPKIAESEVKPVAETGEIVLSRVVVPQTIIVHDGVPTDPTAPNYYVPYGEYIKNVASSEIYATWPRETIIANVLAIMSFTLNRVYTEWYRNQGYDFTITSSTAFDHKWIRERNIYESISEVVDEIFNSYLSRPGIRQPILTQYCDGQRVRCPNWMTQWGSNTLGEQGYTAIQILRNFYGSDMYINTAEQVSGVPSSFPGYNLTIGASGDKVQQVQEQLDVIAGVYTAIPRITADGVFGEQTAEAVRQFQKIFKLPVTGVIDFATWYRISHIYVGITRIAEYS